MYRLKWFRLIKRIDRYSMRMLRANEMVNWTRMKCRCMQSNRHRTHVSNSKDKSVIVNWDCCQCLCVCIDMCTYVLGCAPSSCYAMQQPCLLHWQKRDKSLTHIHNHNASHSIYRKYLHASQNHVDVFVRMVWAHGNQYILCTVSMYTLHQMYACVPNSFTQYHTAAKKHTLHAKHLNSERTSKLNRMQCMILLCVSPEKKND